MQDEQQLQSQIPIQHWNEEEFLRFLSESRLPLQNENHCNSSSSNDPFDSSFYALQLEPPDLLVPSSAVSSRRSSVDTTAFIDTTTLCEQLSMHLLGHDSFLDLPLTTPALAPVATATSDIFDFNLFLHDDLSIIPHNADVIPSFFEKLEPVLSDTSLTADKSLTKKKKITKSPHNTTAIKTSVSKVSKLSKAKDNTQPRQRNHLQSMFVFPVEYVYYTVEEFEGEATALQSCDADPSVLAEYVIALLKHDKTNADLRTLCLEQLDEFLKHETETFVSKLFVAVQNREYLPKSVPQKPQPSTTAITTTAVSATATQQPQTKQLPRQPAAALEPKESPAKRRRRSLDMTADDAVDFDNKDDEDEHDEHDGQQLRRKRRFGDGNIPSVDSENYNAAAPFDIVGYNGSGYEGRSGEQWGAVNDNRNSDFNRNGHGGGGGGVFRSVPYGATGFAPQNNWGAHANNMPVPVGVVAPGVVVAMGFAQNGSGAFGGSRGGVRSRGRCYEFDAQGTCSRGEACHFDHVPKIAPIIGGPAQYHNFTNGVPRNMIPQNSYDNIILSPNNLNNQPGAIDFSQQQQQQQRYQQQQYSFRGRGAPRGNFRGRPTPQGSVAAVSIYHGNPANTTLMIDNIPRENCTLDAVLGYFKKFGTITDVAVEPEFSRARVRFENVSSARNARASPEVIFGNRFVKVYFYSEPTQVVGGGNVAVIAPALAPAAVGGSFVMQNVPARAETDQGTVAVPYVHPAVAAAAEKRKQFEAFKKQKEQFVATQLETQKMLMEKLESKTLTPKQKAELFASLKIVSDLVRNTLDEIKASTAAVAAITDTAVSVNTPYIAAAVATASVGNGEIDAKNDDVAILESLKAEAAAIGVDTAAVIRGSSGPILRGPWNSRGGGGNNYAPRSFNLDNRTKKLLVKGVQESQKVLLMQQLKDFGMVTDLKFSDSIDSLIVTFSGRHEAEKAIEFGLKGVNAESLEISWYEDSTPTVVPTANPITANTISFDSGASGNTDNT
ncbi:hypothetical protein HK100_011651 [Physocladia obscura]|uniref:C3H1-type domain-containing protein n=1 Tax=Physocladia obscura TaxID=109957 RepID=A0AAD5T1I5_9FUNG|nr:hypothetical protein HK100_011651 [Physocladia obscura]